MLAAMLDGVATGYEEAFDFPLREGAPRVAYLLASVPRSGSTYVSHLLWKSGCLGAPLEYLNFEPAGPYGFACEAVEKQKEVWRSALRRRTSPNGVFGLKAFPLQLEAVQRQNPQLNSEVMRLLLGKGPASRVIQLRRRDRTAHAISYARAILSGIWRREQEGENRVEPEYSQAAFARAQGLIEQQERAWDNMCGELGISPLVIWFEDALADPDAVTQQVAQFLGIEIGPGSAIRVPEIERQSQTGARAWAEAHSRA